ncbi:Transposase, Mutator family [Butyrivibrio proteoclasticus]|uniref:Mutator family transposase n=1 Tax=Butyrivibrio proteoclasticus TaxID=43305 RepID=A0A1I5UT84_9FIRM|nr:Transposase, Mutator family [Butyrivibrio proteoclasticus]
MANKKKEVFSPKPMTEGKKAVIQGLLDEYDIQSAEAIQAAFPNTEHQRCIVHMVRNTLKYVANKDMKAFARDLKTIYTAADEKAALKRLVI